MSLILKKFNTLGVVLRFGMLFDEKSSTVFAELLWALTDSNRRPSACKADALNQLS